MSIPIFEKVERIRAAERLTQAEFSEKIGVSANTLNAMKSRGSSPRFEVIENRYWVRASCTWQRSR
jgi:transcriptional regulator with XRE-family HTH domain